METASTTIVTSYLLHINKVYTKKSLHRALGNNL